MESGFVCTYCEKRFSLKTNLTKHVKVVHGVYSKGTLPCPECNQLMRSMTEVRVHLQDVHEIEQSYEDLQFSSMEEFEKWKKEIEDSMNDMYVKHYGSQSIKLGKKTHLYCHRSGNFSSKSTGIRSIKSQGTNKIRKLCPAGMEVIDSNSDNGVFVKFWKTYMNHISEIGRAVLPKDAKKTFSDKLAAGIPVRRILDDIRESSSELNRVTLTEPQDLRNLKRKILDQDPTYHSNDVVSVELFVNELESLDDNPRLHYKRQNVYDKSSLLKENDLMIVLMTQFQKEMLQKFGNNKICIDSTHGTNSYDFQLITVMVVDEFCNGCPVCYCLTNRLDTEAVRYFLEIMKGAVGQISTQVFMSDDAPAFFNAWKSVMGPVENRLLCAWHVDKNLKENLKKISNQEKQKAAYKTIRVLLTESDPENFDSMLESFLDDLQNDPDTLSYYSYFQKCYSVRKTEWATAYRIHLGINTNMHLEAFHKVLKYHYLRGCKNHRLDICLKALLKLARDKIFERMIKLSKNKYSTKDKSIQKSHTSAEKIDLQSISQASETSFLVQSEMNSEIEYLVSKENVDCHCGVICRSCKICVHAYSCTCPDYTINANVCKHIHACIMKNVSDNDHVGETASAVENEVESLFQLTGFQYAENNNDIFNLASTVANMVKCKTLSEEMHSTVVNHLKQALDILNKGNETNVNRTSEPINKKVIPQRRFVSTRKKRKFCNTHEKPNFSEAANIKAGLLGTVTEELIDDPVFHDHFYQ